MKKKRESIYISPCIIEYIFFAAASKSVQDPLADATTDLLWQWELRDNKVLPKEHKAGATLIKRQSGVVASRLSAIDGLVKAVETYKEGASTAKVAKAFELLNKTKVRAFFVL